MLTLVQVQQSRRQRRHSPSLKQLYQEYILERVEAYKNSIPRGELLRLGDEAVGELQATAEGQFVLTEVLMLESVDRLIIKRLSLPSYPKWRRHYLTLRAAQREPTHWGIEPTDPVTSLLPRLEHGDCALLIGSAAESLTFLLAAHDVAVTFVAGDLACVERVENRAVGESLAGAFAAYVVQLGCWLPETGSVDVVAVDTRSLEAVDPPTRHTLISQLQTRTKPEGVHVLLGSNTGLAPQALLGHYDGWKTQPPKPGGPRSPTVIMSDRPSQSDTPDSNLSASL
jgi:hypothetical protein